ncbi:hypothetical protein ENHY17A_170001 [Moraxellaceae bacterium 17A]|nr:hypothetical protein ENHY17A_170001 [Moraxellaceae bacterium 17A]
MAWVRVPPSAPFLMPKLLILFKLFSSYILVGTSKGTYLEFLK